MPASQGRGLSRRSVLFGGLAVGGAAAAGAAGGVAYGADRGREAAEQESYTAVADAQVSPFGAHQAGIATPIQSNASFVAFTLTPGILPADLNRLMKIWSDDIARLTQGEPALADGAPELAEGPASLTITVGWGPGVFALPGLESFRPAWLEPLPAFTHDDLQQRFVGGDLIVQIAANDPMTVAHAQQVLIIDARDYASLAYVQRGFHRPVGTSVPGTVGRNLMGQVDGIVNPAAATSDFSSVVWSQQPGWFAGGTGMVIRRIRMDLDVWGSLDQPTKEHTIGRDQQSGAPLTGGVQADGVDLQARDDNGLLVISPNAHVRLASPHQSADRLLRRPYNYDDGLPGEAGLIYVAFAADPSTQFIPIQQRLDEGDLLNQWTTAVGSSIAAILPGFQQGSWLGRDVLATVM